MSCSRNAPRWSLDAACGDGMKTKGWRSGCDEEWTLMSSTWALDMMNWRLNGFEAGLQRFCTEMTAANSRGENMFEV